jgi:hypothetical protein
VSIGLTPRPGEADVDYPASKEALVASAERGRRTGGGDPRLAGHPAGRVPRACGGDAVGTRRPPSRPIGEWPRIRPTGVGHLVEDLRLGVHQPVGGGPSALQVQAGAASDVLQVRRRSVVLQFGHGSVHRGLVPAEHLHAHAVLPIVRPSHPHSGGRYRQSVVRPMARERRSEPRAEVACHLGHGNEVSGQGTTDSYRRRGSINSHSRAGPVQGHHLRWRFCRRAAAGLVRQCDQGPGCPHRRHRGHTGTAP